MTSASAASKFHFIDVPGEKLPAVLERDAFSLHASASLGDRNTLRKIVDAKPSLLEKKDLLGRTPLVCSILHNQVDCASLLIKAGARVNNSDNCGQTALHLAVNKGSHRCVKLLLSSGAVWHQKDCEGVTSLHLAAIHRQTKCLALILKELRPGEIDIQDSSKKTALHWSAAYTNIDHIRLLLNQDANICIPDVEGKTPVHWAATSDDPKALDCVKVLLEKEPDAINWQDYEGRSALHLAIASGTTETIEYLTSRENCDINIPDNMFCTPLHWAAKLGLSDKVGLLLDRGTAYNSADGNGATPLHYAAHHNEAGIVKVFLSRSYITDEPDNEGRNALIWAAARNANEVIKTMADHGMNTSYCDKNGVTALHAAAIQGHTSTIELLLDLKVPIDISDKAGMTPLLRACEMGRAKATQILINQGASLVASDKDSRTCIHWAAQGGHAYLCQILLHHGCTVNSKDLFGMTPLHYASLNGYINCVSVLLESGADPDITDNEGKTSLHWAVLNDHFDVIKLLCEYNAFINSMALQDGWITPLDFSFIGDHTDISEYLQSLGGLTSFEIQNIAASKIQVWFRKHRAARQKLSSHSLNIATASKRFLSYPEQSVESLYKSSMVHSESNTELLIKTSSAEHSLSSSSTSHILQNFSGYEQLMCAISSANNGCDSFDHRNCGKEETNYIKNKPSRIPVAVWRINRGYSSCRKEGRSQDFCKNCQNRNVKQINYVEERSVMIIQRTWRRFSLKNRFRRIRNKVKTAFLSGDARKDAEKEWCTQLDQFYAHMM